jgi:ribosomal protein S18 acetylase RimI-like enzyme
MAGGPALEHRRRRLAVFEDNPRAIAFYERMGWTRGENSGGSATFYRRLNAPA